MSARLVLVLVCATALAMASSHENLHRAREHHSSLIDAQHATGERTQLWIVATDDIDAVVRALNTHLTAASVTVERNTPLPVVRASADANHDELVALLMGEQRAGTVEWFHRERVSQRKGH